MSDDSKTGSGGCFGSLYSIATLAFCILSIVWYADFVINDKGQYGPEYSYIISWFSTIGIYSMVQLSLSPLTIIFGFISMCTENVGVFVVYFITIFLVSYGVCCWILAEGVAVNNTFSYPCKHLSEFNVTDVNMMSGNGTIVCAFYNNEFSTLFIYFCVMFSFSTLTLVVLGCIGSCMVCAGSGR